jgi:hypothetical protein
MASNLPLSDATYYSPVLFCKNCRAPIWLPPCSRYETYPDQSPWRWGNRSLNFACLACRQVFEYSESDCLWSSPLTQKMEMIVHQLSAPCGMERCAGLIHIFVAMKKVSPRIEGASILSSIYARGIPCEKGHENAGPATGQSSLSFVQLMRF